MSKNEKTWLGMESFDVGLAVLLGAFISILCIQAYLMFGGSPDVGLLRVAVPGFVGGFYGMALLVSISR